MGLNLPLTRRRDPDYEAWLIFLWRPACRMIGMRPGFALAGSIPAKLDCRILCCFIHP
jgi:hypothetical protein